MGLSGGFFPPRIGLVAGDAALLIVPLYNAVRLRTVLLTIHRRSQSRLAKFQGDFPDLRNLFCHWLDFCRRSNCHCIAGAPAFTSALAGLHVHRCNFGTARIDDNLTRTFRVSGPAQRFSLAHTEGLWPFSVIVSTVSFLIYTALLRRR